MLRLSLRVLACLLALAPFCAPPLAAQSGGAVTVSGKIVDAQSRAPLPYLTVQLLTDRDSAFVAGRLTTASGAFSFAGLRKGRYVLRVRAIGYQPLQQRVVVGELSPFLDLGAVLLEPDARQLAGIKVTADSATPSTEAVQVTVRDNVSQAGGSVLQAMSTLPGVTVSSEGKVLVRGSDKVLVLIDGKQTALTGAAGQSGLDNLPASSVERIELINNPSARYDANASAGIINLVLRKQDQRGVNGRVGLVVGAGALVQRRENLPSVGDPYRFTPKFNPSVAINRREGPTNVFLRADWLYSPTLNKNEFSTRRYTDGTVITQQVRRNRRTDYATINGGLDRALGTANTLNVTGFFNREKILDHGDNPYFAGSLQNRYRLWQFLEDEVKYTGLGTAVFTHRFPEPGHTLTSTAIYSFHREDEKYFFTNTLPTFVGKDAFKLLSDEHITDLNIDYVKPLRQGRLETGFRGRYRSIPVNMRFFPSVNSPIDTGAGGWATYRETIPALYGTYVYESERLEFEGGVRLEDVRVNYEVNPQHNTYRSDGYRYIRPFPTLRVALKRSDRHRLTLAASQRVDRPNEVDIRIFPKYDEPELIKVGNPALQPQFTSTVDLAYRLTRARSSLSLSVFERVVDGTITRIATQVPGSVLLYNVFQNGGNSRTIGTEFSWQRTVSPRLTLGANATVYQQIFDAFTVVNRYPVPSTYTASRQALSSGVAKGNAQWQGPFGFQSQIAAAYYAPDLIPQGRIGRRFGVDIGTKKSVRGGRGEWVLNATDLFGTMPVERTIRGNGFTLTSTDYLETQVVRAGYSWKF
ncbi:MAG: TonB-dependent receptor [Gemmatimonadaceae bacterium]|nr:TonB-dependent receptor [Gemmatimonadaceae bacterium]